MIAGVGPLLAAALIFLLLIFAVAEAAERGWIPARVSEHPFVYALALGVYTTTWTFYGSVGFARTDGYGFLTVYLGATLSCLAIPFLWRPLFRLVRERQLASLADVLAFRYQSQATGVLVTLAMFAGSTPYIALQIRAFSSSLGHLSGRPGAWIGLAFSALMIVFAILFGARHAMTSSRHVGLLAAMAVESIAKLCALAAVGAFALFSIHGGPSGLSEWLSAHPEALRALQAPAQSAPWTTLLILSFSAAFLLPRQFHVAFTECPSERALDRAAWAFPLLLLLLNLPIPLILWAGQRSAAGGNADLYVLTVVESSPALAIVAFIGGFAAASGMIVVTSVALANMAINHLVLPLWRPQADVYRRVAWTRRALTALAIIAGYAVFLALERVGKLVDLGLVAFLSVAQTLPGVLGVLLWRRATRTGAIAGLIGGLGAWWIFLAWPMLARAGVLSSAPDVAAWLGMAELDVWTASAVISLSINTALFAIGSLAFPQRREEQEAAIACTTGESAERHTAASVAELTARLASALGDEVAEAEVARALGELGLDRDEKRAMMLQTLSDRLERNLSGLFGPLLAPALIGRGAALDSNDRSALAEQIRKLRDLARDADEVRSFLYRALEDLPIGVCALGPRGEIVVWNTALAKLTGLPASRTIALEIRELPAPWSELLHQLAGEAPQLERELEVGGKTRVLRLGRSGSGAGAVLLVDDQTQRRALEASVAHQDRLASIGRLAAGVAHEIGNPLTGMLMLAHRLADDQRSEVREAAKMIEHEGRRIHAIVGSLVTFSRGQTLGTPHRPPAGPVALGKVIDDALALVRLSKSARAVELSSDCPKDLYVRGDAQRLAQVFVNLLGNACDASAPGASVRVKVSAEADQIVADVIDQGTGIDAEIRDRIFDPFFTTKDPGEGTGLGLALVHSIVREHGGKVALFATKRGEGATFRVELPASRIT